jgi:hypothetical protein
LANGVIFATASIADASIEASRSEVYAPTQNGALTAQVLIEFDQASALDAGWWAISLDRASLVTTIVYNDVDLAGGKRTWTMQPSACIVNTY